MALASLKFKSKLILAFTIIVLIELAISILFVAKLNEVDDATVMTQQRSAALTALNQISEALVTQEAALRGYLLSGREDFLPRYQLAAGTITSSLAELGPRALPSSPPR